MRAILILISSLYCVPVLASWQEQIETVLTNEPPAIPLVGLTAVTLFLALRARLKANILTKTNLRRQSQVDAKPIEQFIFDTKKDIEEVDERYESGKQTLQALETKAVPIKQQVEVIEAGLSLPTFRHDDSEHLKAQIKEAQLEQLKIIQSGSAAHSHTQWTWMDSRKDGRLMSEAYKRLLLKAFNAEFDMIRKQMRHSTYDTAINKLIRLSGQLHKLAETVNASISEEYLKAKLSELTLWHRELQRREDLKQERKRQQQELREQNKSLGRNTDNLEDEIDERSAELEAAKREAEKLAGKERAELERMIASIEREKSRLEDKFQRSISQAQITRSGYIYVISNVGSFGEGVIKIGMTRRLEPMDRVVELGDASVPFRFDVHTLAYVSDAPAVEKALHQRFNNKRVNKDNHRKEFFKVAPEEVHQAMKDEGICSDWYYDVDAKEYNESILLRAVQLEQAIANTKLSDSLPDSI